MNTHDIDMGLPPLPAYFDDFTDRTKAEIDVHVRAAIDAARAAAKEG